MQRTSTYTADHFVADSRGRYEILSFAAQGKRVRRQRLHSYGNSARTGTMAILQQVGLLLVIDALESGRSWPVPGDGLCFVKQAATDREREYCDRLLTRSRHSCTAAAAAAAADGRMKKRRDDDAREIL